MPPSDTAQRSGPVRAIVLSGGGARGAYEAGVLRYILDDFPRHTGIQPRFEILCGTSVGAIHACFMAGTAHQETGRGAQLSRIWQGLRVDEVFHFGAADILGIPRRLWGMRKTARSLHDGHRPDRLFGLLNTQPLERLVLDAIPWDGIGRNLQAGLIDAVCVATTQIATGRAVVFVEQRERKLPPWASQPSLRMQSIRLTPLHALASAAIPMLFPAVRVGARYYADGGLRLNTPLAPAVRLGANRVLVVGLSHGASRNVSEALAQQRTTGFGNPMFLFGKVLNALMLSPIDTDLARMHLINDLIDAGTEAYGEGFLPRINEISTAKGRRPMQKITDLTIRPSVDLGLMAGDLVRGRSGQIKLSTFLELFVRLFGNRNDRGPREADLLSYLLFDESFTKPLTELGHADASLREEELIAFFSDDEDGSGAG